MKPSYLFAYSSLAVVVLALSMPLQAQILFVPNSSFEQNGSGAALASGATDYASGNNNKSNLAAGWVFTDPGTGATASGENTLAGYSYTSTTGTQGTHVGFLNLEYNTSTHTFGAGTITSQAAVTYTSGGAFVQILPFTTYTLTVALGNQTPATGSYNNPGVYTLNLLTGSSTSPTGTSVVATTTVNGNTGITNGTWLTESLSFTTGATGASIGKYLFIQLGASAPDTGSYSAQFDNVQLSALTTPEPGTWALLVGGLSVLLFRLRRRSLDIR